MTRRSCNLWSEVTFNSVTSFSLAVSWLLVSSCVLKRSSHCSEWLGQKHFQRDLSALPYFISTCQNEFRRPVKRCSIIQIEYCCFRGYGLFIRSLSPIRTSPRQTSEHEGDDKTCPCVWLTQLTHYHRAFLSQFNKKQNYKVGTYILITMSATLYLRGNTKCTAMVWWSFESHDCYFNYELMATDHIKRTHF